MGNSTVNAFEETTPICIFSAIVGQASTGKTHNMSIVRQAIVDIEEFERIPTIRTKVSDDCTVEALQQHLSRMPHLIGTLNVQVLMSK